MQGASSEPLSFGLSPWPLSPHSGGNAGEEQQKTTGLRDGGDGKVDLREGSALSECGHQGVASYLNVDRLDIVHLTRREAKGKGLGRCLIHEAEQRAGGRLVDRCPIHQNVHI